jgi:hypothetical protein
MRINGRQVTEFLGLFAVVASLLFVGLQLSLDRKLALADSYSFTNEGRRSDARSMLESDPYMELQSKFWLIAQDQFGGVNSFRQPQ